MLQLALIGCGAIGSAVLQQLQGNPHARVTQVVVRNPGQASVHQATQAFAPGARVLATLDLQGSNAPGLVVECAGHSAVVQQVLPALRAGVPAVVASTGALHDAQLLAQLAHAAAQGGTQVQLVAGAVGGIDALAAARLGGLTRVHYTGRKPPRGWAGTPAAALCDLATLRQPFTVFEGTAREAARLYPQNANVAATVSLAGLGFDDTGATLIADPEVTRNVHRIEAEGAFGRLDITLENEPLVANPKTSALTVFSVVRAIHNAAQVMVI
jgi:aspartate dehydrogenase